MADASDFELYLASSSPRRRELLQQLNISFHVLRDLDVDEARHEGESPSQFVERVAHDKALAGIAYVEEQGLPPRPVLGADTCIELEDEILGKPITETEARRMLEKINGRQHSVITGFTIIDTGNKKTMTRSLETKVYIKKLTSMEIDAYIESSEPLDKAGAYAIQGLGSVIVEKIEGDYFNVIGLPLSAVAESLREFGVYIL